MPTLRLPRHSVLACGARAPGFALALLLPLVLAGCGGGGSSGNGSDGGATASAGTNGVTGTSTTGSGVTGSLTGSTTAGTGGGMDPCNGAPVAGECVSPTESRSCAIPTGNANPTEVHRTCASYEHCVQDASGGRCDLVAGACHPGGSVCGTDTVRTCNAQGAWEDATCGGKCRQTPLGATCDMGIPTETYSATFGYEYFAPADDYSDWNPTPMVRPAAGVLAVSLRGTDITDAAIVGDTGAFSLKLPAPAQPTDQILFLLLHPDMTGAIPEFGVFDPMLTDPMLSVPLATGMAKPWLFGTTVGDLPSGSQIVIDEAHGSGAVHIYLLLYLARQFTETQYGARPRSIVGWFHLNSEVSCGACFLPMPVDANSFSFDSQIFFSATQQDRAYWSDAVGFHEIGHYTMWTYGTSPEEGGQHCIGHVEFPGIAWSEGWATGFSSIARGSPYYFDKQGGSMFWVNLGARSYSGGRAWNRTNPSMGLIQMMDENDVAATIWELSQRTDVGQDMTLNALTTPRLNTAPFGRGYTRHRWNTENCEVTASLDTMQSKPFLADYLDALVCAGAPAAAIDEVTDPTTAYPYPSNSPICP